MSTTRRILRGLEGMLPEFEREFSFYLDSLDHIFDLQARIGLGKAALSALPEGDQNRFKTYKFLADSVNTTSTGALRLFSGNVYSDAFALLRMIYEAACLMQYGNQSPSHGDEVYTTIFKSSLAEPEHSKAEWALIRKAEKYCESQNTGLVPIRQYINNFGAHISRAKIVLGNVGAVGDQSASTISLDNSRKREYVGGLDMLHWLLIMVLEQYDKQAASYPGALPSVPDEISTHNRRFLAEVRPRLLARCTGK